VSNAPPATAPPWAHAADVASVWLSLLSVVVALTGGVRIRLLGVLLSVQSPGRLLLAAAFVCVVRHAIVRRAPIHRDLPRRFSAWKKTETHSRLFAPDGADRAATRSRDGGGAFVIATLVLFTALTLVMTAPQIRHMGDAVHDPGDPLLNLWVLDWVAHQLRVNPAHLFDANIFVPERWTLAYSETLLAPSAVAAPLLWMGVHSVRVYNIVFLSGFILSGVGAALLVRRLTGCSAAAVTAGVIFAFLPFRFDHYPQLQLQQAEWIPLAFWAYHRLLDKGRVADAIVLGVCVVGQLLSCMYYGLYLASYLVVVGSALVFARGALDWPRLRAIAIAAAVAVALFAPVGRAYIAARTVVGEREAAEISSRSATWRHYLAAPPTNEFLGWSAARFGAEERNLYPGVIAVLLAAAALWPPVSATRLAYAAGLGWGMLLTFGFNAPAYRALYAYVPVFRALRIPSLAVILVGFSLAVLAGFGLARLSRRCRQRHLATAIAVVCCVGVLLESCSTPMHLDHIPRTPPPIYADLMSAVGTGAPVPIVEIPVMLGGDQTYMYYSTFHRQRLLNGYSGFFPPSYIRLVAAMRGFPDAESLRALRARGAKYALVHGEFLQPVEYTSTIRSLDACRCGVTLLARRRWADAEISLYRIDD
jgi:hypothetical protein